MATKTKNKAAINLGESFKAAGVVLMTAAVTLGLVEIPKDEEKRRAVVTASPVFEFAHANDHGSEPQRREREESGPHYISYGIAQRSPGRAGKI